MASQQQSDDPVEPPPLRKRATTVLPHADLQGEQLVAVSRDEDRFDRVSRLGEGGIGTVELVRDNDIGRFVAIKQLKNTKDAHHILRFVREARCLGQLEHPGIVPVHDVGQSEDGSYYLVMKHLEGQSLEALIEKLRAGDAASHAAFPMYERVRICETVLRIMEYAHDRGIVHRDIKPANIMIGEHGEVTIVDWGLAKRMHEAELESDGATDGSPGETRDVFGTQVDAVIGTPLYMSPEQASGQLDSVGKASDAYSMAVVFYELLSLEHYLHGASDIGSVMHGVREGKPKLAYWVHSPHQERVPIELAHWLHKAMQKRPGDRFASVAVMRAELQRAAGGQFDVVCPTTLSRRVFRSGMDTANKRPVAMLLVLLAVALLAAYGAWSAMAGLAT